MGYKQLFTVIIRLWYEYSCLNNRAEGQLCLHKNRNPFTLDQSCLYLYANEGKTQFSEFRSMSIKPEALNQ